MIKEEIDKTAPLFSPHQHSLTLSASWLCKHKDTVLASCDNHQTKTIPRFLKEFHGKETQNGTKVKVNGQGDGNVGGGMLLM